ncbi:hypothetical protein UT300012_22060 [Paraclostridium bifermentans]
MLTKYKRKFIEEDTKRLAGSMTHETIDKTARELLGERPYKLGATKVYKIDKIKECLGV